MKKYWLLVCLLLSIMIHAQQEREISEAELVDAVVGNNLSLKINEKGADVKQAQYRQSNAAFLPQIQVSHDYYRTNNPVFAFSAKLNQGVFTQADFDVAKLNDPDGISNFTTTLQVQQPLLNLDKLIQRKSARYAKEAQELKNQFKEDALIVKTKSVFMQLKLAYASEQVLMEAKRTAEESYKVTKDFYDNGYLDKSDLLKAEVRSSTVENQLEAARNGIYNISDQLNFLMQSETSKKLVPRDSLQIINLFEQKEEGINVDNTTDVQAMRKKQLSYNKLYESKKFNFLPRLNAFGNIQYFDNDAFQTGNDSYFFGASLQWDLFKGYQNIGKVQETKAKADRAQLEYEEYLDDKQNKIKSVLRALNLAENKISRNKLAKEQAVESLRIIKDRYDEGLEKTADLLQAQSLAAQKRLAYLQAVYEYNYNLLYYQLLTEK
ncbi:MAG: TolC family protein [Psychroflexus sp.]|nr:TolC family protein [Psychroflexus sp.]MDR9447995.1 TolC family protein [Psychroflexus sp.]